MEKTKAAARADGAATAHPHGAYGSRAQSSLEALAAFAVLLSALSLLIIHAEAASAKISKATDAARERIAISGSALSLDTAGSALSAVKLQQEVRGRPSGQGGALEDKNGLGVQEPLIYKVSMTADGEVSVVGAGYEKT